ncbi:SigE family RNA polymerase sigma factor [Micromonospora sp. NPDC047762]|uniref:SigE family RNA polymerase sigma factor n=1 Tax=unclassified Micromonospora TaxID=2617518 RepID=UPI0033F17DBE
MTRSGAMVADPVARRAVPATRTRARLEDPAEAEFYAFVRARTPALQRSAFLLTGDRHLAEDLVQDALARTHRALGRLADGGQFEAYTRTVMYHLHVRRWRRTRIVENLSGELADRAHPDSDHAGRTDLKLSLLRALDQLTRRQRAVLVLRFFEDRSEAEAADVLSCSIGTIKSQTSKALARMRQIAPELLSATETKGVPR